MEALDLSISELTSSAEQKPYKHGKILAIDSAIRVVRNPNLVEPTEDGAIENCTTLDTMGRHILMQNVLAWSSIRPAFEKLLLALQDSSTNLRFLFSYKDLDEVSSLSKKFAFRKSQIVDEYKLEISKLLFWYQVDRPDVSFFDQIEKDNFNSFMAQLQYNSLIQGSQHPDAIGIFSRIYNRLISHLDMLEIDIESAVNALYNKESRKELRKELLTILKSAASIQTKLQTYVDHQRGIIKYDERVRADGYRTRMVAEREFYKDGEAGQNLMKSIQTIIKNMYEVGFHAKCRAICKYPFSVISIVFVDKNDHHIELQVQDEQSHEANQTDHILYKQRVDLLNELKNIFVSEGENVKVGHKTSTLKPDSILRDHYFYLNLLPFDHVPQNVANVIEDYNLTSNLSVIIKKLFNVISQEYFASPIYFEQLSYTLKWNVTEALKKYIKIWIRSIDCYKGVELLVNPQTYSEIEGELNEFAQSLYDN